MAKVKCVKRFYDIAERVDRNPGDEWDVTDARAKALNATEYGTLVEVAAKPKAKARKGAE